MTGKPAGRVVRLLDAIGAAALLVLMVVVFVDVGGRSIFNRPLPWGTELLEVVLAVMVFAIYPVLAMTSGHITVDLITVRPSLQKVQRIAACIVGAVIFMIIAWCTWRQAIRSYGYGDASALLQIPTAYVLGGMSAMSVVTSLGFLTAVAKVLRGDVPAPHVPVE